MHFISLAYLRSFFPWHLFSCESLFVSQHPCSCVYLLSCRRSLQLLSLLLPLLPVVLACDSGDIPEKLPPSTAQGMSVRLTGTLQGVDRWSDHYDIVLAAFTPGSDYTSIQKSLAVDHVEGKPDTLLLSGIPPEVGSIELCVVDRLRERIATLHRIDVTDAMRSRPRDTLRMEVGSIDVSMFSVVERLVFAERGECTRCHGDPSRAAGHLSLLAGNAHSALVGHASALDPSQTRVLPGNSAESWLVRVLTPGNESLTRYADHPNILNNEVDLKYLKLLKDWIDDGARD